MRKNVIIIMIIVLVMPLNVFATTNQLCHQADTLKALRILSYVITVMKILIPVILILTSAKSLANAIINQDDKAISSCANMFIKKFIIGVFIAFIPSIVFTIMSYVSGYDNTKIQFTDCTKCLTSYKTCDSLINKYK